MAAAALIILLAASLWLIAVGLFMACRPKIMLDFLSLTASSHRVNLTEQGLRMLCGMALVIRAGSSKFPELFEVGGWFLICSSAMLMLIPLRLHAGYAKSWAHRLPHWAVRVISPFSLIAGLGLAYATT